MPQGRYPNAEIIKWAQSKDVNIEINEDPNKAVSQADAMVTDTWVSMGDDTIKDPRKIFSNYQVDEKLFQKAREDAIFMHCLPAHRGEEVVKEVIDGPSRLFGMKQKIASYSKSLFYHGQLQIN